MLQYKACALLDHRRIANHRADQDNLARHLELREAMPLQLLQCIQAGGKPADPRQHQRVREARLDQGGIELEGGGIGRMRLDKIEFHLQGAAKMKMPQGNLHSLRTHMLQFTQGPVGLFLIEIGGCDIDRHFN